MDEMMMFGDDLLQRAATAATYPATPSLRASVLTSIEAPAPRSRPELVLGPMLAASAAVLLGTFAAAVAIPSSREAVADFFGIEGSRIDVLPTPSAGTPPTPFPKAYEIDENASPIALSSAAKVAGFTPTLAQGEVPDATYAVSYGDENVLILRYPGFDLWQGASGQFEGYFEKGVPSTVRITDLTISDGVPATWISGGPHFVQFYDVAGVAQGELRTVERNTLIWRTSTAFYRIETDLSLDEARRIAETLP